MCLRCKGRPREVVCMPCMHLAVRFNTQHSILTSFLLCIYVGWSLLAWAVRLFLRVIFRVLSASFLSLLSLSLSLVLFPLSLSLFLPLSPSLSHSLSYTQPQNKSAFVESPGNVGLTLNLRKAMKTGPGITSHFLSLSLFFVFLLAHLYTHTHTHR